METKCNIERNFFKTVCRVMNYNEYLTADYPVPFTDIGHLEGNEYKSDIKIWLNGTVTMEAENDTFKTYEPFECNEFTSFIISTIHKAKYIVSKGLLDEFTYNSFADSIKYLFEKVVPYEIASYDSHPFIKDTDIPIINDKANLDQLIDLIDTMTKKSFLTPVLKYISNNNVFYILRSGNVVVNSTCTVRFNEFGRIMEISSLLKNCISMIIIDDKDEWSRYFNDLVNLISESV
nr:MAG TPA: hypothetical protein [Caudoviricetes sp.]